MEPPFLRERPLSTNPPISEQFFHDTPLCLNLKNKTKPSLPNFRGDYRYVDDALLLVRRQNIDKALLAFNGFDNNLQFTDDRLKNKTPNFLHLQTRPIV